jgi:hypothetical protein
MQSVAPFPPRIRGTTVRQDISFRSNGCHLLGCLYLPDGHPASERLPAVPAYPRGPEPGQDLVRRPGQPRRSPS